jgi:hypothetical protein
MRRHRAQPVGTRVGRRAVRWWLAGAALGCLGACAEEPPTVRLIVEAPSAPPAGEDPVDRINVVVVGTGEGRACACEWAQVVDATTRYPIVMEFIRGTLFDDVSIRVVWSNGSGPVGRQYLYASFPESGVTTVPALLTGGCWGDFCTSDDACRDERCFCRGLDCGIETRLADELLHDGWDSACSYANCILPARDADADADADAGADADVDADAWDETDADVEDGETGDDVAESGG